MCVSKHFFKSTLAYISCLSILMVMFLIPIPSEAVVGNWSGGQAAEGYRLRVSYMETNQNPINNTSKITVKLYLEQDAGCSIYVESRPASININGVVTNFTNIPTIQNDGGVTTLLGTAEQTITHDSDGSKSITVYGTYNINTTISGTHYNVMQTSKVIALDTLDRVAPNVSLSLSSVTSSSVTLTATANATCDAWRYSTDNGNTWNYFGSTGTSSTLTISNCQGGTTYPVIVRGRKQSNHLYSTNSNTVNATTKPNPPGNVVVDQLRKTSAYVTWNASAGANSYSVYRNGTLVRSGLTGTSYTFTGLTTNTSYQFGVVATGAGGNSDMGVSGTCVTFPSEPTNVQVSSQTSTSVSLTWSQNQGGNASTITYYIYRGNSQVGTSTTCSFVDSLYANTDCSYTVCAVNSAGSSSRSSAVSVIHQNLAIDVTEERHSSYSVIIPSFYGGLNNQVDESSLRYAMGSYDVEDFENNLSLGTHFQASFAVLQNQTYTIYAKDFTGQGAIKHYTVNRISAQANLGAFSETNTDIYVDSVGFPIAMDRTYNSMTEDGPFGCGWSFRYAKNTGENLYGTKLYVELPDGTVEYFQIIENNDYTLSYEGVYTQSTLKKTGNQYILTTQEGIKYTYTSGCLTSISDRSGNTVTIALNQNHLPETIIDVAGREYEISYENGKIAEITDPIGRTVSYSYNQNGLLESVEGFNGQTLSYYHYTNNLLDTVYDEYHQVSQQMEYNDQHQVVSLTDGAGNATLYSYSIAVLSGEITVIETIDGQETTNIYNPYGQVVSDESGVMYEYNEDSTVDKINYTNTDQTHVTYTYDSYGNVILEETRDENDQLIESIATVYMYRDNSGKILSMTETRTTYSNGVAHEEDETEYAFDINENIVSEGDGTTTLKTIIYSDVFPSLPILETEGNKTTQYVYDDNGYLIQTIEIENFEVTGESLASFNDVGMVLTREENGLTESFAYDIMGNVLKHTQSDSEETRIERMNYDSHNQVILSIPSEYYVASQDRLMTDAQGIAIAKAYFGTTGEFFTYDAKGNLLSYINVAGNKTVNTFDSKDQLVKTVTYEIDVDNTAIAAETRQTALANGLVTRYVFDTNGNLTQTIYPHQYVEANDLLDVEQGINAYSSSNVGDRISYETDGNVTSSVDSFGVTTTYVYDNQNRVIKTTEGTKITRYVYDGDNLVQVIYPSQYVASDDGLQIINGEVVNTYNNANIGDRYTYDEEGNLLTFTDSYGHVTTNTYTDGTLASTTNPNGSVFTFSEDGKTTTENYSSISNNQTRTIVETDNGKTITGSNNVSETYTKNSFGEISEYCIHYGNQTKDYTYTYDSNGNILTISLNGTLQQKYTYNESNELIRVDDAVLDMTTKYVYDFKGNITHVRTYDFSTSTGSLGPPNYASGYGYNSQNQRSGLSYDSNGNVTSISGYQLVWNNRQLASATKNNQTISYTYNDNGIRTGKTVGNTTTTYTLDENNNVVEQSDGTNTLRFIYDSEGAPVYLVYNNATYTYEKNLQGDIIGILNQNNAEVVQYVYDEWGWLASVTGSQASTLGQQNPLRYRGYYYDTDTGLYYLQSRYYSPSEMRFISQDDPAYSNTQGQPIGSNLYAYCLNNPVNYFDSDGALSQSMLRSLVLLANKKISLWRTSEKAVYQSIKVSIFLAANIYLSKRSFDITRALFNKFMWGGSISTVTKNMMKDALIKSDKLTEEILAKVKKCKGSTIKNVSGSVAFKDGDLYYGIHYMKFYILSGVKLDNNKWKLTVKAVDTFDFTQFWLFSHTIGASAANDLGWAMQKTKMGIPFTWYLTFTNTY